MTSIRKMIYTVYTQQDLRPRVRWYRLRSSHLWHEAWDIQFIIFTACKISHFSVVWLKDLNWNGHQGHDNLPLYRKSRKKICFWSKKGGYKATGQRKKKRNYSYFCAAHNATSGIFFLAKRLITTLHPYFWNVVKKQNVIKLRKCQSTDSRPSPSARHANGKIGRNMYLRANHRTASQPSTTLRV